MLRGLFVTGTDTGVGKTVTCAALLHRYSRVSEASLPLPHGRGSAMSASGQDTRPAVSLRYWKPIQTGIEQDDDTAEVRRLAACREEEILAEGIRLRSPVSPHLAAQWSGVTIRLEDVTAPIRSQPDDVRWIVEGAGGVLVPINENQLMIDLMRVLRLPVVVVARSSLGTINHTLLTLEALRARSLQIAGVVMVGDPNSDNRAAIERYGCVPVLGEMPVCQPLEAGVLAAWARGGLDPQGRLLEFLQ